MQGQDFQRWVEHGIRDYGRDPWQFLRELAQNSRDAGAHAIHVEASVTAGRARLSFTDDGAGMSFDHARRYLFRLYASSKGSDPLSAGEFGIGFWTLLRFGADAICIESNDGAEAWSVEMDRALRPVRRDGSLRGHGTRITLSRPATEAETARFRTEVRDALLRYCRYLERRGPGREPLPVVLDGEDLHREIEVEGALTMRFDRGAVRGAVGLGTEPRVELYARGLPVWQGTVLDELVHAGRRRPLRAEVADGLAPIFVLNGDQINVERSRTAVVDDPQLRRLRRIAAASLDRLVRLHLRLSFPRSPWEYLRDWIEVVVERWLRPHGRSLLIGALYLAALSIALFVLADRLIGDRWRGSRSDPAVASVPVEVTPPAPGGALPDTYAGAQVDAVGAPVPFQLSYAPPGPVWFRLFNLEHYERRRGLVPNRGGPVGSPPRFRCTEGCVEVELRSGPGEVIALPIPSGHRVDLTSVRADGQPAGLIRLGRSGEVLLSRFRGGELHYRTGPEPSPTPLSADDRARLVELPPDLVLPPAIAANLSRHRGESVKRRVRRALGLIDKYLRYDVSTETAARYRARGDEQRWLRFVLDLGRGDCDVVNGVLVVLLRDQGIPARLVAGVLGREGQLYGNFHAWAEYYDRGWHRVDATERVPRNLAESIAAPASVADPFGEGLHEAPDPFATAPTPAVVIGEPRNPVAVIDGAAAAAVGETGTPAVREPTDSGSARRIRPVSPRWIWYAVVAGLGAVVLAVVVGLLRRRRGHLLQSPQTSGGGERMIAQMLAGALADPDAWRGARALWTHPLLPTLGQRRISLASARRLSRSGRLFAGGRSSQLARAAVDAGRHVLDRGDPLFATLVCSLPGIVDLDQLDRLKPASIEEVEATESRALLIALGELLRHSGGARIECLPVRFGLAGSFQDVDLRSLRLPARAGWPRRFIAVDPRSPSWDALARGFRAHPALALFAALSELLASSVLLLDDAEAIRRRASARLLRQAAR